MFSAALLSGPQSPSSRVPTARCVALTSRRLPRAVGTRDDGDWGPLSKAALNTTTRALQAAWGAHIDGDWGPKTDAAYGDVRRRFFRAS